MTAVLKSKYKSRMWYAEVSVEGKLLRKSKASLGKSRSSVDLGLNWHKEDETENSEFYQAQKCPCAHFILPLILKMHKNNISLRHSLSSSPSGEWALPGPLTSTSGA